MSSGMRAVCAVLGLLIGIAASITNAQAGGFGFVPAEKITKRCGVVTFYGSIDEASGDGEIVFSAFQPFTADDSIIDRYARRIGVDAHRIRSGWKGNLRTLKYAGVETGVSLGGSKIIKYTGIFFESSENSELERSADFSRWFFSAVGVINKDFYGLLFFRFGVQTNIHGAYPGPLSIEGNITCRLGSVGLNFDRFVGFFHFVELAFRDAQRHTDQNNDDVFAEASTFVFRVFFGAIGVALCVYGVNKSREIGGWAVWFVLLGWSCFLLVTIT